jgi:hypothetical protein
MDGVFINLTNTDMEIKIGDDVIGYKNIIISANPDLVTPVKEIMYIEEDLNATISSPLKEDDVRYLLTNNWVNTIYNKITRSEEPVILKIFKLCPYTKYSFTQDQIDKINKISNGRTRLFILDKNDIEYWSDGKYECPFRRYRLFTKIDDKLIEYPIPKTYLDVVVEGVKHVLKQ